VEPRHGERGDAAERIEQCDPLSAWRLQRPDVALHAVRTPERRSRHHLSFRDLHHTHSPQWRAPRAGLALRATVTFASCDARSIIPSRWGAGTASEKTAEQARELDDGLMRWIDTCEWRRANRE
jgi:hypothetical protein